MSIDTGNMTPDVIVEVAPVLTDDMATCVGIDPALLEPGLPGYDEPQPTDPQLNVDPVHPGHDEPQPTDTLSDPLTTGDPAVVDTGPIAYDEPQPTHTPTDVPTDPQIAIDPFVIDTVLITSDPVQVVDGGSDSSSAGPDGHVPVDPMPDWVALGGEAGSDSFPVAYMQMDAGSTVDTVSVTDPGADIQSVAIFTLAYDQVLVHPVMLFDHAPGRGFDPLPYERSNSVFSAVPEPEIDRTPVHYAASEPVHTGLNLL